MAKIQHVKIVGVGKGMGGPMMGPSPASIQKERDYQAEDDHRVLTRADEVRQDPKRLAGARKHARNLVRQASRLYSRGSGRT